MTITTHISLFYKKSSFFFCLLSAVSAGDAPVLNPLLVPPNIAIGDNTVILCSTKRGSSPMDISWLHNGKNVEKHTKYKISTMSTSSQISIGPIQAVDIGNFTCVAKNAFGEDSRTETVFMEGKRNDSLNSNAQENASVNCSFVMRLLVYSRQNFKNI